MKPFQRYTLITFGVAIGLTLILLIWVKLDLLLAWLLSITLVTFLTYGFDKAIAGKNVTRVPEKVLLLITFCGGTIGAIVGMEVFRHKTVKTSFRKQFFIVIILQVIIILIYYFLIKPNFD
jgi:uncharacterized membrane protein YsdA (DUF1294 family)